VLATDAFLDVEDNNIWSWDAANQGNQGNGKAKEYAKKITALTTKALKDEDEGIDAKEVLYAILASEGLTLADILVPLKAIQEAPLKEVVA